MDNVTPETLYKELSKTVIGQEGYLKSLCNAAWLHSLRYGHYKHAGTAKTVTTITGAVTAILLKPQGRSWQNAISRSAICHIISAEIWKNYIWIKHS